MRSANRQSRALLCLLLATFLAATGAWAQAPAAPNAGPTLAAALAGVPAAPDAATLTVDAAQVTLPEGTAAPDAGAGVEAVALAFGRAAQKFGVVTAVAPPTMTLLNADPHDPNIYLGMEQSDAFTLLAASLNDAQWRALTGTRGLSPAELGAEDQRQLFAALFPGGKLVVQRSLQVTPALIDELFAAKAGGNEAQAQKDFEEKQRQSRRDLSGDLGQARLRLAQDVSLRMPTAGKPDRFQPLQPEMLPNAGPRDEIVRDEQYKPKDTLFGVPVRATVPNAPRPGDLDFDAPALKAPVALGGLRTVGDLVARVGAQTRTELYADPRWERKALAVTGAAAPAGDLLRALAFCLTGTLRSVGAAYVLTADPVGLGTIRRRWADFEDEAREKAAVPVADAADRLFASRSPDDLAALGGPFALSPAQAGALGKFDAAGGWERNNFQTVPFAQLTPAQQDAARGYVALTTQLSERMKALAGTHPDMAQGMPDLPTLQGSVRLETRPVVQLLLPSEAAPLDLLSLDTRTLFNPSNKRREQLAVPTKTEPQAATPKPSAPVPSLKDVLAAVPRRAILAAPRTPAAVDALVAGMKTLGLNELWLDVFSGGKAHFRAGNDRAGDVLAEALRVTKDTGVRVLAVLDLFAWGRDAPAATADRDILGETSAQAAARRQEKYAQLAAARGAKAPRQAPPAGVEVSPSAPDVRGALLSVVRALAERPGVAGIVWRDATPPGYGPASRLVSGDAALGYALPARLAFLRAAHADPLDVPDSSYLRADTSLPGFDDAALTAGLAARWDKARAAAHQSLLRSLRTAAAPLAGPDRQPFVYVKQGSAYAPGEDWYGSWDGPPAPLPAFRYSWEDDRTGQPPAPERPAVAQAKAQSKLALCVFPMSPRLTASEVAPWIQASLKDAPWDGLVLDAGPSGDDPLAKLAW